MSRLALIHWNEHEGRGRAEQLRRAGHETAVHARLGPEDLRRMKDSPPEVVVIDLSRMPSHGCAVGVALRRQKATRSIPLVFVGGDPEKVAATRKLLPDAVYTEWAGVEAAVDRALTAAPSDPVVPETMAGYAGRPLPQKLGMKPGRTVTLLGAPADFEKSLGPLPEGVILRRDPRSAADLVLLFVRSRAQLEKQFQRAARALAPRGGLWIAWPKQASGIASDLTQTTVRAHGLNAGFVDYKICAIDRTWSGLLFARRGRGAAAR